MSHLKKENSRYKSTKTIINFRCPIQLKKDFLKIIKPRKMSAYLCSFIERYIIEQINLKLAKRK